MEHTHYKKFISTIIPESLSPVGIDTHAHICSHYFKDELYNILLRAKENAVSTILSIALTLEAYEDAVSLYENDHIAIYTAVGIHPCDVLKERTEYKKQLHTFLQNDTRIKAIGETGLDYHWQEVPHELQKESLIEHIHLAKEYKKTLVLHAREAEEDVFTLLCNEAMEYAPVIWHCYSGSATLVRRIVDKGWYISFAGNITYPNASRLREALHAVPLTQLLIETDSPYLAPQPKRGKHNEPSYLIYTAEIVAHELGIDVNTLWCQSSKNAEQVLML